MTHSGADIAQLLSAHGLRPSRALGQNFVADPNTVRRIARLAGLAPGDRVLEIGAGLGSLTLALAETGAHVVAVETDRHLVPVLRSVVEPAGVEVVEGDAMTLDVAGLLAARGDAPWSLVANLPYNVATPLVMRTLTEVPAVTRLLVMVQREVGERMAAAAGEPRLRRGVGPDRLLRASARSSGACRRRCSSRARGWSRCWCGSCAGPTLAVDPALVSYAAARHGGAGRVRPAPQDAAALAGRRGRARRVQPRRCRPEARAEELDVAAWGRLAAC